MRSAVILFLLLIGCPLFAHSQIAATPPMGWNSWDSYGLTITEAEFKQNVDWLHTHLQPYGWQYVVIDEGWYLAHPEKAGLKNKSPGFTMDANGRYQPALGRFPSTSNGDGFTALAEYVHSLGLKIGIHIVRGIPRQAVERNLPIADSKFHVADAAEVSDTCAWNSDNYGVKDNAAGQAYYNSVARLYAGWGIDFVKVDCISRPYKKSEIHMMSDALRQSGRAIVLSLSPGPTPLRDAADAMRHAQMWRISNDFWDVWAAPSGQADGFPQSAVLQFSLLAQWEQFAGPGHWPDADMLPFGILGPRPGWGHARKSRLTVDEARTVFTLWAIARSPLMLGANLLQMDPAMKSLLTNREVIAVDQQGSKSKVVLHTGAIWIWTANAPEGNYVAAFNVSNAPRHIQFPWKKLGVVPPQSTVRDLWRHQNLSNKVNGMNVTLRPHACVLYYVR